MGRLLAHRNARIYLAGQVFSLLGDSSLWLAMGIWVKTLTHSNSQAGLVFFFFTAASLAAPGLGLLVDRYRRRPLLIATNALAAGVVLCLLLVRGRSQVWLIDAVMFAYGLSYGVLGPAGSALLKVMIPVELLADANAALRTVQEGLRLLGPLLGAGLFVVVGAHLIALIDALTFAFPVAALALLRVDEAVPTRATGPWLSELTAGIVHIRRTARLRRAVTAGACTTIVFGFAETITYAIASIGLHRPAAFVGVLAALQGAGALVGGLTAAPLIRRLGEPRLMASAMFLAAVGVVLEIPPLLPLVVVGDLCFGAAIPWLVVGLITLTQRSTPSRLQGRVYAAAETLITTPQTISIALGAALVPLVGYQALLIAMAGVFTLTAAYLLRSTTLSNSGRPKPMTVEAARSRRH